MLGRSTSNTTFGWCVTSDVSASLMGVLVGCVVSAGSRGLWNLVSTLTSDVPVSVSGWVVSAAALIGRVLGLSGCATASGGVVSNGTVGWVAMEFSVSPCPSVLWVSGSG